MRVTRMVQGDALLCDADGRVYVLASLRTGGVVCRHLAFRAVGVNRQRLRTAVLYDEFAAGGMWGARGDEAVFCPLPFWLAVAALPGGGFVLYGRDRTTSQYLPRTGAVTLPLPWIDDGSGVLNWPLVDKPAVRPLAAPSRPTPPPARMEPVAWWRWYAERCGDIPSWGGVNTVAPALVDAAAGREIAATRGGRVVAVTPAPGEPPTQFDWGHPVAGVALAPDGMMAHALLTTGDVVSWDVD